MLNEPMREGGTPRRRKACCSRGRWPRIGAGLSEAGYNLGRQPFRVVEHWVSQELDPPKRQHAWRAELRDAAPPFSVGSSKLHYCVCEPEHKGRRKLCRGV